MGVWASAQQAHSQIVKAELRDCIGDDIAREQREQTLTLLAQCTTFGCRWFGLARLVVSLELGIAAGAPSPSLGVDGSGTRSTNPSCFAICALFTWKFLPFELRRKLWEFFLRDDPDRMQVHEVLSRMAAQLHVAPPTPAPPSGGKVYWRRLIVALLLLIAVAIGTISTG